MYTLTQNAGTTGALPEVLPGASNSEAIDLVWVQDEPVFTTAFSRDYQIGRTTGGTTPTAGTPEKLNSRSAAAQSTGNIGYSTNPTISGNPLVLLVTQAGDTTTLEGTIRAWRAPNPRYRIVEEPSGRVGVVPSTTPLKTNITMGFSEPDYSPPARRNSRRSRRPGYGLYDTLSARLAGTRPSMPNSSGALPFLQPLDWPPSDFQVSWLNLFGAPPPPGKSLVFQSRPARNTLVRL